MAKSKKNSSGGALSNLLGKINFRYVAWTVVPLLIAGAAFVGAREGWTALKEQPQFAMSPSTLVFGSKPECVRSEPMLAELRDEIRGALSNTSIFHEGLCDRVAHELRASPWVLSVEQVRRVLPDQLNVQAVFRLPAGIVELPSSRYMVDRDGYWLPSELYRQPTSWQQVDLPHIVHENLSALPVRGRPWAPRSLAVGARLTVFLARSGILKLVSIKRIDVTAVGQDGHRADVVLVTEGGRQIKWGTTDAYEQIPGLDRAEADRSDREKLTMLRDILQEHPNLHGLEYVDLRFSKIYYRHPDNPAQTTPAE